MKTVALLLAWLLALSGCSAVVELDSLSNGQCGERQKACSEQCVDRSNPRFGCGASSCTPCSIPNAVAVCSATLQCAIAVCRPGFEDCDRQPENGCEVDIEHDAQHCGSCTAPACVVPNASPICANRQCAVLTCNEGFGECNRLDSDGCETDLRTSSAHCGTCGRACPAGQSCVMGACR